MLRLRWVWPQGGGCGADKFTGRTFCLVPGCEDHHAKVMLVSDGAHRCVVHRRPAHRPAADAGRNLMPAIDHPRASVLRLKELGGTQAVSSVLCSLGSCARAHKSVMIRPLPRLAHPCAAAMPCAFVPCRCGSGWGLYCRRYVLAAWRQQRASPTWRPSIFCCSSTARTSCSTSCSRQRDDPSRTTQSSPGGWCGVWVIHFSSLSRQTSVVLKYKRYFQVGRVGCE